MNIVFDYLKFNNNITLKPKTTTSSSLGRFSLSKPLEHDTISFKRQWRNKESGAENFSNVDIILNNYFDNKKHFIDRISALSEYDLKNRVPVAKKEEYERWVRVKSFLNDINPKDINKNIKKDFFRLVHIGLGLGVGAAPEHVNWRGFQDIDYQNKSCEGVNDARAERVNEYLNLVFYGGLDTENYSNSAKNYLKKLQDNYSYKILTLLLAFHDISIANRKIPLILDIEALARTFETIENVRRDYSVKDLSKMYHSNIIEGALNENKNLIVMPELDELNDIKTIKECWVKIDGYKKDDEKKSKLVRLVEIFSNKNWCTHSSHDKAKDQVETGDFYVCIKKDSSGYWAPVTGVSTCRTQRHKSKVIELQGIQNNYILSEEDYNRIKTFLFKFQKQLFVGESEINLGAPSATEQLKCSNYLTNSKKSELKNAILDVLKNKNIKDEDLKLKREIQLLRKMGCNPREEYYIKCISQMDFAIEGNDYNDIFKYEIKPVNTNKIEKSGIPLPKPITINTLNSAVIPIDASFVNTSKSLNIDNYKVLYLDKYNPMIKVSKNSYVKLSYLGVNEDALLDNVARIDTFYMNNASIKEFPNKLTFVNVLYCTKEQQEKFKENIEELQLINPKIKIIKTN